MAYNQDSNSQRYPPDQHYGRYQQIQHENSYNNNNNADRAGANGGRQFEAPYGGLRDLSEHPPQPQGSYNRAYPNDGYYRRDIQFESKEGHLASGDHSTSYGANGQRAGYRDNSLEMGQAVTGNYQPSANPSYAPGIVISVSCSFGLPFR